MSAANFSSADIVYFLDPNLSVLGPQTVLGYQQCWLQKVAILDCLLAINIFDVYCQTSNRTRTLVGNKLVDYLDVVGASPVGAAPTTSSF